MAMSQVTTATRTAPSIQRAAFASLIGTMILPDEDESDDS